MATETRAESNRPAPDRRVSLMCVEGSARRLLADLRDLAADVAELDLTEDEKKAISENLQPGMDRTEDAFQVLFPGGDF